MKKVAIATAFAIGVSLLGAPMISTPASALCNAICKAKCTLNWKGEFKSEKECLVVWSRRNGPTGRGCGGDGMPFQRCE